MSERFILKHVLLHETNFAQKFSVFGVLKKDETNFQKRFIGPRGETIAYCKKEALTSALSPTEPPLRNSLIHNKPI